MINKKQEAITDPYVVGIGASAGGLEAIHKLFDHIPSNSGLVYVIIQCLSSDRNGLTAELLTKHTDMQVCEVEDQMLLKPNSVYIIPNISNVIIQNGKLILVAKTHQVSNNAIDIFFSSLANEKKEKAIAIILSGAGTDGAIGAQEIRENRGFVMVQDPITAKFDGMPNRVIKSGAADLILSPERIALEMINRVKGILLSGKYSQQDKKIVDRIVNRFGETRIIEDSSGFVAQQIRQEYLVELLNDMLLEETDYAAVFINESYELIRVLGNLNKFFSLPDKQLKLNLLKMLPEELSLTLNMAIHRSVNKKKKIDLQGIVLGDKTNLRSVNVVIKPFFEEKKTLPTIILILLKEERKQKIKPQYYQKYLEGKQRSRIVELELKATKEMLQVVMEEQETANKELQSTNEELQLLNEELHIVNTEHQFKIKELIELNDDLNNYFKSTQIGKVFIDRNFVIRKFTQAVTEQINLIDSDIGRSLSYISNNINDPFLYEDIQKVIQTGQMIEKEIQSTAGKWFQLMIYPYIKQDKKNDGAIITFVDITKLKGLNSLVSGVIDSSKNYIVALKALRARGRIKDFEWILLNARARNLLSTPREEVIGKPLSFCNCFVNEKNLPDQYKVVVETGETLHLEYFSEIEKRWFDIVGVKMEDGVAVTFNDITEKKEAEQKLRIAFDEIKSGREKLQLLNKELEYRVTERTRELSLSEERFRILSLATNDVIKDWDLVKNTIWWNRGIEKLFGYKDDQISDGIQFWQEKLHPDDKEMVLKNLDERISSGSNQWGAEYRFKRADNTYAFVMDRGYIMHDENEMSYRMITYMVDLTKLKLVEEDLKRTNDNLVRINSDLDNFIYTASHDLKAPISNIEGLIYSMNDVMDIQNNAEAKIIIGLIHESILKFKSTIKDLTEITKTQKEMLEDEERVDFPGILAEVKSTIKELIIKSSAKIEEDIQAAEIYFSRKNLRSILYNLLSNAIKYRSPERVPFVQIKTKVTDHEFIITVSDNGLGIDKAKQAQVFSMFKRFHDHVDGSGVGMYIVKRIVDNAGGEIQLESELGKGSSFRIILPSISSGKMLH